MHSYPKIPNLFVFDEETTGRRREFTCPEFEYLQHTEWIFTEKIDGTNIRVIFGSDGQREVRGRTDKAQLTTDLVRAVLEATDKVELTDCTLYGEGYGAGIQKGGKYRPDKGFLLFDLLQHGEPGFYAPWEVLKVLAVETKIPLVPVIMRGSLWDAYKAVQAGLQSRIANDFAEGLVGRPAVPVRGVYGERLLVKVKHRDYCGKELL
jgi:hypothetical protein